MCHWCLRYYQPAGHMDLIRLLGGSQWPLQNGLRLLEYLRQPQHWMASGRKRGRVDRQVAHGHHWDWHIQQRVGGKGEVRWHSAHVPSRVADVLADRWHNLHTDAKQMAAGGCIGNDKGRSGPLGLCPNPEGRTSRP